MRRIFGFAVLVIFALPVFGHHSDSGLDTDSVVSLEGTVAEFQWRNPHVYITIDTIDEQGNQVKWALETNAIGVMSRRGWTQDSFAVGEYIMAEVNPARNGRPYGELTSITRQDGTAIATTIDARPSQLGQTNAEPVKATTLEGGWIVDRTTLEPIPGGSAGYMSAKLQLTEKAQIAQSNYDELSDQNPETRCIGRTEPFITALAYIFPIEISINEEERTVSIQSGVGGYHQTVYLDGRGHPENGERTNEGHAIGWWEGDTLVVDTRLFADHRDAYFIGVPSGSEKHLVQRYRLIDDGARMEVEFMLEDPEYIVGSLSDSREMVYLPNIEIAPYECDLESAQRFLN